MNELRRIIVIGASAGGFDAIAQVVEALPVTMNAAVFIVIHLAKTSSSDVICHHFQQRSHHPCRIPQDNDSIEAGTIYLAPADFHLLITPGSIRLTKGPHENRWRPSIDVLFRSAAVAYGPAVTGVILSGMLDDGTSGMSAIKRCGGTCIVQEPTEADFSDMPLNVLNHVNVDYQVPVADIPYILDDLLSKPLKARLPVPEDVQLEADITRRMSSNISDMEKLGIRSNYVCPDCGGGLWLITGEVQPRFRCYTGHVYTENVLLQKQTEQLEESLWVSIRMLQERRNLLVNMEHRENESGRNFVAKDYQIRADELTAHIERLRDLLISIGKTDNSSSDIL